MSNECEDNIAMDLYRSTYLSVLYFQGAEPRQHIDTVPDRTEPTILIRPTCATFGGI